jgi:hypothetical protein
MGYWTVMRSKISDEKPQLDTEVTERDPMDNMNDTVSQLLIYYLDFLHPHVRRIRVFHNHRVSFYYF